MKTEKDYPSLAEALAYINQLEPAFALEQQAHAETKLALEAEVNAHNETKVALVDAETAADDAISKANQALKDAPKSYVADVDHIGRVRINFGVDKLTKDQLLEDHDKIAKLVRIKSHAVTVLDEEE